MLCVSVHLGLICVILLLVMTGLIMVMVIRVRRRIAIVVVLVVAIEIPLIVLVISSISFPSSSSPRASGTERFLPPYIRFRLCLHLLTFTRYSLYVDTAVFMLCLSSCCVRRKIKIHFSDSKHGTESNAQILYLSHFCQCANFFY